MHPLKIEAIATRLIALSKKLETERVRILGATPGEEDQIVQQLYKEPSFQERFSEKYLRSKIRRLAASIDSEGHDAITAVADWIADLESFDTQQTVYIPVVGVTVPDPEREVDLGNVTFLQPTAARQREVVALVTSVLQKNPHYQDDEEIQMIEFAKGLIEPAFQSSVLARYQVVAEPTRALERGEEETRRVVEVLRYFGAIEGGPRQLYRVCLQHEAPPGHYTPLAFSDQSVTPSRYLRGPVEKLELSDDLLRRLHAKGAHRLLEIISKPEKSAFEEKLLLAMHWIASAQMQYDNESKLLNLTTALEALLTRAQGYPISQTIAESTALLIGQSIEARLHIKQDILRFYDKRSRLAHGGRLVATDSELWDLLVYASTVLRELLERSNEFDRPKDLFEWLDRQKLSYFGAPKAILGAT